jgi:hypothetical protein
MQTLSKADRSMSHQRPTYGNSPRKARSPRSGSYFMGWRLAAAIAPRLVAGVIDPASR